MSKKDYEIIVIGAGAGGMNAALKAAGLKKNVLLIEKYKPGGECTWSGCIPSKALIQIADEYNTAKKFGIKDIDTRAVMERVREITLTAHQSEAVSVLEEAGIKYLSGYASFVNDHTIEVNGNTITADYFVISTGSHALIPNLDGIEKVDFLTNENIFKLDELPKDIIILGAGAIGAELSQALARLGVKVKLVEMAETILFREEKELAKILTDILIDEGVDIYTAAKGTKVAQFGGKVELTIETENTIKKIQAEKILIALGRKANLEGLNMEKIGIQMVGHGVKVNKSMQTSVPHIYAVGDISGPYLFSHMASIQGRTAIGHICGEKNAIMTDDYAWCTFTHPELARSGLTEEQAKEQFDKNIRVFITSFKSADRAVVDEKTTGVVKVICNQNGLILGASILGERAGEMLGEIQILKLMNAPFSKLSEAIHPYPSYSEVLLSLSKEAAGS